MSARPLEGRVAVVTGASRGIGAAIAERFARAGATVVATARTVDPGVSPLEGTINETVERIVATGGTATAIAADLSVPGDRERLVQTVLADHGRVDVLVNDAAVTFFVPVTDFTPKRLQLMLDVQVVAPLHLSQLVLPSMAAQGEGWILNVSSMAARHPSVTTDDPVFDAQRRRVMGATVYGLCKAALERFSTGLAEEVYADNVAVNALSPNRVVPTPGTVFHHLVRPEDPNQQLEGPEVIAEAALALCSADPRSLTGRVTYSQDLLDELGIVVDASGSRVSAP